MIRASDLKKSDVGEHNSGLFVIRQIGMPSAPLRGGATLKTGVVVQVPVYLQEGETVRINTAERRFNARV